MASFNYALWFVIVPYFDYLISFPYVGAFPKGNENRDFWFLLNRAQVKLLVYENVYLSMMMIKNQ